VYRVPYAQPRQVPSFAANHAHILYAAPSHSMCITSSYRQSECTGLVCTGNLVKAPRFPQNPPNGDSFIKPPSLGENVFACGDYLNTATINGAFESGEVSGMFTSIDPLIVMFVVGPSRGEKGGGQGTDQSLSSTVRRRRLPSRPTWQPRPPKYRHLARKRARGRERPPRPRYGRRLRLVATRLPRSSLLFMSWRSFLGMPEFENVGCERVQSEQSTSFIPHQHSLFHAASCALASCFGARSSETSHG
jgi:hypothetical protein